jgi:shikimate kinase
MGVGKTTIGIELAKKLDIPSFDTDIVNVFTRIFPRYHAMSTLHIG